jgi:peptide/nickel transport system substrate-binding protein
MTPGGADGLRERAGREGVCAVIRPMRAVGLFAVVVLLAAACTSGGPNEGQQSSALKKGGVLRIGMVSDFHEALDPAREYYTIGWEFLRCCLARTLLSFNGKAADQGGTTPIPDLATAMPKSSTDGLTWTFKIRPGVHYGPPAQQETVTAADFIRAMERMADAATAASYPFYYSVIEGFDDYSKGEAASISGLSAPNDLTLQVQLTKPVGYFPFLFTLPATSPIPANPSNPSAKYGVAEGHKQDYGRFLVSTGPYEIQGIDNVDFSKPPDQQSEASGFQPGKSIVLVRNPSWSPTVDPIRKAYVDEIQATIGGTVSDTENKVERGELDVMDALPNPEGINAFTTNPSLKPYIHADPSDLAYYVNMNLAMPPFDDIHVRRAMNFAIDKQGLLRLAGGSIQGAVANHIIPDTLLGGALTNYDPYPFSLDSAKQEMAKSRYDTNHDGGCDAEACKGVLTVIDQTDPQPKLAALIQQDVKGIGITLNLRQFQTTTMYTTCEDATGKIPLCTSEGWVRDFPDAFAFVTGLFSSASLTPSCCDDSLTGATAAQLKSWNYTNTTPTPNVDGQLNNCAPAQGSNRLQCYANVDKYLMENVVPWVPYRFANQVTLTSQRVTNWTFDDFATWIALDQVALVNGGK